MKANEHSEYQENTHINKIESRLAYKQEKLGEEMRDKSTISIAIVRNL